MGSSSTMTMAGRQSGPILSVIIDAYNYGRYIDAAITSALRQSLPRDRYEVIVIDDGSEDDTPERAARYIPEIIYLRKENGGQASALNAGIAIAQGEFVVFLDADDYWHPDKLARVLDEFSSDGAVDVVYHPLALVNNAGEEFGVFPRWFDQIVTEQPRENFKQWPTVIASATSGISWRVSALRRILPIPDEFAICADGYLMTCAPLVARKFGVIRSQLGYYRIHGENNYATFSLKDGGWLAKTQELEGRYNSLFLRHLERLADRFDCQGLTMINDLRAQDFRNELCRTRQQSGIVVALRALWQGRWHLKGLSFGHRLFRTGAITLHLFLPLGLYRLLQQLYRRSSLWLFVQRYVKREVNSMARTCTGAQP